MRPNERFAANLRKTRIEAGLSQERLARAAKLHRTEISLLERAEREPRLSTIVRLAAGLGVPAALLLDDLPERGGEPVRARGGAR